MVVAERVKDRRNGGTTDRPAVARHTARQLQTQVCRIHRIISKWTGLYETQNYGVKDMEKKLNLSTPYLITSRTLMHALQFLTRG